MKSKVYIETTIVSYLVASPTRDGRTSRSRGSGGNAAIGSISTCLEQSSLKRAGATRLLRHADWGLFVAFRD